MRSLVKPALALLTAATLASGVCACGQVTAPTGASPSSSPSTTHISVTTAPPTTQAAPSVDEMYTRAMTTLDDQTSARVKMTIKGGAHDYTVDVRGALDGTSEKQYLKAADGMASTTLFIDGRVYVKGNKKFWTILFPDTDSSRLSGRWVQLVGDSLDLVVQPSLKNMLMTDLLDWAPGEDRSRAADVTVQYPGGVRSYQARAGSDVFAVDAETWLPSRFVVPDSDGGSMIAVASDWNAIEPFTAPTVYAKVMLGDH